jgi:hypothetical protein
VHSNFFDDYHQYNIAHLIWVFEIKCCDLCYAKYKDYGFKDYHYASEE